MEESLQFIQIEGIVTSLIYQNPENGYTVLRLDLSDEGAVTAVGCMPGVSPGENLILTGSWTTHQAFGQQFKPSGSSGGCRMDLKRYTNIWLPELSKVSGRQKPERL
jgi:hypothetical protein